MTRYRVFPQAVISTVVEVEADSPDEAIDKVLDEGFPDVMFTDHRYPDVSEWDVRDGDVEEVTA